MASNASVALNADALNSATQSSGGTKRSPKKKVEKVSQLQYNWKLHCQSNSKLLPATQALIRDTQVAVIIALSTIDETSPLLDGHIEALGKEKNITERVSCGRMKTGRWDDTILTQASNHNTQRAEVGKPTESIRGDYF